MRKVTIRSFFLAAAILSFFAFSFFSTNDIASFYTYIEDNKDWKKVKGDIILDEADILTRYKDQLGLGPKDVLARQRVSTDSKGNEHLHYQHYHNGVRVFGSQLILHKKGERVYLVNGTLVENFEKESSVKLSREDAINLAKKEFQGSRFMWESEFMENWLKKAKQNNSATFYPEAPLVYMFEEYDRNPDNYRLTYEIEIHTYAPELKETVFIDANTGEIVTRINDLHTGGDHPGVAETRYHGIRDIITDSIGQDSFILVDSTRGPGIFTLNAERRTDMTLAIPFYDDDNYWNNVNAFQDEVATDVHWGAEMTYDFYTNILGRQGMSADSVPLISFVHVDENWTNATWNGTFARFGDSEDPNSPLTAIDVVGHEFAHGLTDYTADLVYMDESGALNESFSDIFGTAQEFLYDPATADWSIGEDFIASGGFRSMSNPKSMNHPDTYQGLSWVTGSGDNGGVHTNSGVQNFWFYLLTEGGNGLNDNGDLYDVAGLGLDAAIQIAYGNLNNYLTVMSQYSDARLGGIQAAIDLYEDCSFEVEQTTSTWHAVGVGSKFSRDDISMIEITGPDKEICGVTTNDSLSISLTYNNCDGPLYPGEYIPFVYSVNLGETYMDTLFLTDTIFNRDTFQYTIGAPIAEFAVAGEYEINIESTLETDNISGNNSLRGNFRIKNDQNFDFGYSRTLSPISSCFLSDKEQVSLRLQFLGCDSIAAGEMLDLLYKFEDGPWVSESFITDTVWYADDYIDFTFSDSIDLQEMKEYTFEAMLVYDLDTIQHNNFSDLEIVENPIPLVYRELFTFEGEGETPLDSFFSVPNKKASVDILDSIGFKFTKGLAISGDNGFAELVDNRLVQPSLTTVWTAPNRAYVTQNCVCADLVGKDNARLKYRLNQTHSPIYEDIFGLKFQYSSAMRVLINGVKFTPTFIPQETTDNPYLLKNHSLAQYEGEQIQICFQTHTLTNAENDPYGIGDNVYIDEIEIVADIAVSNKELDISESKIYPNPARDQFIIENNWIGEYRVELWNIEGKLLRSIPMHTDNLTISVDDITSGVYFVKSIQDGRMSISQLIVE